MSSSFSSSCAFHVALIITFAYSFLSRVIINMCRVDKRGRPRSRCFFLFRLYHADCALNFVTTYGDNKLRYLSLCLSFAYFPLNFAVVTKFSCFSSSRRVQSIFSVTDISSCHNAKAFSIIYLCLPLAIFLSNFSVV